MSLFIVSLFALVVLVGIIALFYGLISISFVKLGIPAPLVGILFVSILIGSLINLPILTLQDQAPPTLFRYDNVFFLQPPRVETTVIAINVGGAMIPLLLCLYLLPKAPFIRTAIAVVVVTIVAFFMSEVIPGEGVKLNIFIPPAIAAATATVLAWRRAAVVAFVAGVLGTIIGADLLNLPDLLQSRGTFMSIGGAGVFDGIFLVAVIAAFLSPGARKAPA